MDRMNRKKSGIFVLKKEELLNEEDEGTLLSSSCVRLVC